MANKARGSVRMGPISLFTLIIALCLAVMAVLSVSTAKASYSSTERQANATASVYNLESNAQQFMANVDDVLAEVRAVGGGHDAGVTALKQANDQLLNGLSDDVKISAVIGQNTATTSATSSENETDIDASAGATAEEAAADSGYTADITATFTSEGGPCLAVQLAINDDATYQILLWKTSMQWRSDSGNDVLWSGTGTD